MYATFAKKSVTFYNCSVVKLLCIISILDLISMLVASQEWGRLLLKVTDKITITLNFKCNELQLDYMLF